MLCFLGRDVDCNVLIILHCIYVLGRTWDWRKAVSVVFGCAAVRTSIIFCTRQDDMKGTMQFTMNHDFKCLTGILSVCIYVVTNRLYMLPKNKVYTHEPLNAMQMPPFRAIRPEPTPTHMLQELLVRPFIHIPISE